MPVLSPVLSVISAPAPPARTRSEVAIRRRVRPRPPLELSRMTRYRGGTYSHTVGSVVFTDGSRARTDLIRLNPNIEAYSLDFAGVAPMRPSRYQLQTWSAVPNLRARSYEAQVDWILRHSYPVLGTAELSRRLRAAGYPLGPANITEHEAIAATQAAIWLHTNDLALDNRRLDVPIAEHRGANQVTVEFDGEPQLGGYSVDVACDEPVSVVLEKSVDGSSWQNVSGSRLEIGATGHHRKVLGVGSTLSASRHGSCSRGYRHYRLTFTATAHLTVGAVDFWLYESRNYRNTDHVVHLYDYLLAGAGQAGRAQITPQLVCAGTAVDSGLVGPFRLQTCDVTALSITEGGAVVDANGVAHVGPVAPDAEFYLRPAPGRSALTLTASVPASAQGFGGRVLTGVARDEVAGRFTPVALTVPAQVVADFHISWVR